MAAPWEKYAQPGAQPAAKPWEKYGGTADPAAPLGTIEAPRDSLFRMDSDFLQRAPAEVGGGDMLWATVKDMFGSRQGAAEYLAKEAGGSVEMDERGDPLVVLPTGERYRLNDAGIDSADIGNVVGNVAAAWLPASWAAKLAKTKNLGLGSRMALQGGTVGATDAGLQLGADQNIDPARSALAVLGGSGGEALGTVVGSGAKRVLDGMRASRGGNLADARALVGELGAGGDDLAAKVAPQMDQIRAGADPRAILGAEELGFTYTLGQRMTDPAQKFRQLTAEESMRQTPAGFSVFDTVRQGNTEALERALTEMGTRFGGKAGTTPAELVQGSASNLRQQASELDTAIGEAYRKAGEGARSAVGVDAIKALPDRMKSAIQDFGIDPELTPASFKTIAQVSKDAAGIAEAVEGGKVTGVTLKALEQQRRILNNRIGSAANPTDKAAMMALKREFDTWLDEAVDGALISGDPSALQALKEARALRTEFGKRFEGKGDADKFIQGLVEGTRTPEELINVALGASQVSKASGARFIERLRVAAQDDAEIMGGLRAAHLDRLTRGATGEPLAMGQILRNIKATEFSNASVVKALYSPAEWAEVKRLASALEPLIAKGDFAKSSGTSERMMRMLFSRMGLGTVSDALGTLIQGGRAQRAVSAPVKAPPAPSPAAFPAAVSASAKEIGR